MLIVSNASLHLKQSLLQSERNNLIVERSLDSVCVLTTESNEYKMVETIILTKVLIVFNEYGSRN